MWGVGMRPWVGARECQCASLHRSQGSGTRQVLTSGVWRVAWRDVWRGVGLWDGVRWRERGGGVWVRCGATCGRLGLSTGLVAWAERGVAWNYGKRGVDGVGGAVGLCRRPLLLATSSTSPCHHALDDPSARSLEWVEWVEWVA
jgi:hypothetical protein